jgi:hypothetical protein
MDAPTFRTNFPEFADSARYPTPLVTFWLGVGASLVNADRWGELSDVGVQLCTAHHLVISARDQATSAAGGLPGQAAGMVSSKSVDKISVTYDTGAAMIDGAGFWALSSYGVRYLSLARMFGAGGLQL